MISSEILSAVNVLIFIEKIKLNKLINQFN